MSPLLNVGLRAARTASVRIVHAMERLDLLHAEGQDLKQHLVKIRSNAEATVAYEIQKLYPQHQVIGSPAQTISQQTECSDHYWHINAIDGLNQYAHSLPLFALTLNCYEQKVLKHSIILCPLTREEFIASRGSGAQLNGHRIRASRHTLLQGAQLGSVCEPSQSIMTIDQCSNIQRYFTQKGAQIYLNMCSAMTLAYTAAGRLDGCWLNPATPQTIAAGLLLARECGALAGNSTGSLQAPENDELVVANSKLFKLMLQSIHQGGQITSG